MRCKVQVEKMTSYVLHLIRNMPCQGNLEGRYIGRTESPLPMESVVQLAKMKEKNPYPQANAFYASPSTRCVDTLKVLYPQADPEVIFEMAECDFGDWENKTAQELQGDPAFTAWIENGSQGTPPNGESGDVFFHRVIRGFTVLVQNLMVKKETSAVLVTHGGVIMGILAQFGLPRAGFTDWMCQPGRGYSIRITPSLWMRSQVVEVFALVPEEQERDQRDHFILDVAREAASRAFPSGQSDLGE